MQKKATTPSSSKSKAAAPAKVASAPAKAAAPAKKAAAHHEATARKATDTTHKASETVTKTTTTKKAAPPEKAAAPEKKAKPKGEKAAFFTSQKALLLAERESYARSAESLKAQADSLALEHEPGDVQFDEEGGEGGTANVDREMDLHLSAQARATILEIDRALEKIADGTYGLCESCHDPIPEARLEALPYAALCVKCKSGGLSSRR